ncbi:MAG: hypothetical protein WDO19_07380 [Bacteroidota bacterium]
MTNIFSPNYFTRIAAGILTILLMNCQQANSQERAVLVSSGKIKLSTKFLVCIKPESGKIISLKYDSHCWRCKIVNIPMKWDVVTVRKRTFIKPVL